MVHKTLEEHVKHHCSNCKKPRNGEELQSIFEGSKHYVAWNCENCGNESWWTEIMGSHVRHLDGI